MKILILGGDGYLGWPTAIHLSALNYEVYVVDNYMRRKLMEEHNVKPLYPVLQCQQALRLLLIETLRLKMFCSFHDLLKIHQYR